MVFLNKNTNAILSAHVILSAAKDLGVRSFAALRMTVGCIDWIDQKNENY